MGARASLAFLSFAWGFLANSIAPAQQRIESTLVVLDVASGRQQVVVQEVRHIEAPNWTRDGRWLVINCNGRLEMISVDGKERRALPTGFADQCNNDHGFSFDGTTLVISHNDVRVAAFGNSRIFVLPATGGEPRLVTEKYPSYWHGISPDGKHLVYCAERGGNYDVYRIAITGGAEERLTSANGLDDGPEYSYDGQWIYFNSHRTGRMHLYRMKPDGSQQEQLTDDAYDNWFPHPSPDGKTLAYIAYLEDQKGQHPFGRDVKLRLYDVATRTAKDITPVFFGGQGSFNVPSWSPDGKQIAFVKYRLLN
jgi:Tol biopolymer transport system component